MPFVITLPCVGVKDGACLTVCPVDVIHPKPGTLEFAGVDQLFIDPTDCIDCGLCVDECPTRAIFAAEDVPAEWSHFIERNAAYFREHPR